MERDRRLLREAVKSLSKKKKDTAPEPATPKSVEWSESFDESDHTHFLRMSAELIQEASNHAARSGDIEQMLKVAAQWGVLAEYSKDLARGRTPLGFRKDESNE
jgi:hypothetical protein